MSRDEELEELVADALAREGELIPTTESEVLWAEDAGVEHDGPLPEALAEYRPERDNVVPIGRGRRMATHALAAVLGAAAAAALLLWRQGQVPTTTLPAGESATAKPDAAPPPEPEVTVALSESCPTACCAGARCALAKPELSQCSSGRSCVACAAQELQKTRYRVRLSGLALSGEGQALRDGLHVSKLELCVRAGSSALTCAPAHAAADGEQQWTVLPLVISAQDAVAGFELQVRPAGVEKPLARWQSPVLINATLLCNGLSPRPKTDKGDVFGSVSVFLDDTHYVEVARAAGVESLLKDAERIHLTGAVLDVYETEKPGAEHFALVVGPMAETQAEKLRWSLLDAGVEARVVLGGDHVGAPRPVSRP
ncbi:MAG: hypothetical protein KC776_34175 [Myxococcales bacterium]|nr:hypothetical protein [Myxococcales bacterium]MCB9583538.1 hypothetical protein [Polyangiaceae bacterium]